MRDFLRKFVLSSILASAIFVFAKLIGIWFGLSMTGASFTINTNSMWEQFILLASEKQTYPVAFYSNILFSGIAIFAGAFVLTKTILFNDLTRSPRVLVKVIHLNLTGWLEDGQDMYPKLFAWEAFLWLASILVIKDSFTYDFPLYLPSIMVGFSVYYTYQVFSFLDAHISDMISYLHGTKR